MTPFGSLVLGQALILKAQREGLTVDVAPAERDPDIVHPATTALRELNRAREHFFVLRSVVDAFDQSTVVEYDAHDLLLARTLDPVGNSVTAENDYRVLQPREVTDPNRNRFALLFDALGMVVATAVKGKVGQALGDTLEGVSAHLTLTELRAFAADPQARAASLLGNATTRIVHDLARYQRAGQPVLSATLARETHFEPARDDQTKVQLSFSFSDGFGREIQKKQQAEAGDAPQRQAPVTLPSGDLRPGDLLRDAQGKLVQGPMLRRWVGTGRTVFNNRGQPVKQYEPFFSATHLYEPEPDLTDTGVSPVLFYDPLGRVVTTLHPNHSYEKVVFDAWQQTSFDLNDTAAASGNQPGDPRTDPDIQGFVRAYFETQPATWQTWYAQRIDNALGPTERAAARKAEVHANTPTRTHLDVMGRVFITLAHNKFVRDGVTVDERYATRTELDIEGNTRTVRAAKQAASDQRGRIVARYAYDLLGNRIHQASMDAGQRWQLNDAAGQPIRAWDSRRFLRRSTYDALRRLTALYVTADGVERQAERTVYGESQGDAQNHRSHVYQRFDAAGVVTHVAYDFKGNLREQRRELLPGYKLAVNWLQNPATSGGSFTSSTTFDALNRPLSVTSPDGSEYRPTFNEANLLDKVAVRLRGAGAATSFVTNVSYNAKGQREQIDYGNGAITRYEYDPLTFRMSRLRTTRPAKPDATASQLFETVSVVQNLSYTYDPVGNLTRIEDAALQTLFRNGESIEPVSEYTYDAVYRLIEAVGREHIAQTAFDFEPANSDFRDFPFFGQRANPNDLQALRNFSESYRYDAVGNIEALIHRAGTSGWTRSYDYQEGSLLETGKPGNRLTRTREGDAIPQIENYAHDAHGNMTAMPHLAALVWSFKDELQQANLGGGGNAYYVYDAAGQRVRKVIERQNGTRHKERIYLGGFEIYREYAANGVSVDLERESFHVLDDKQRIALVETQTIQNGTAIASPVPVQRYQLSNHLGSASVELDQQGALITYEEFHAFGTTSFQAGRSAAEVSLKRYRYSAKERDEESGLQYFGARYYAVWLSRWTAVDPKGLEAGVNAYAFVINNPVRLTDPDGRDWRDSLSWTERAALWLDDRIQESAVARGIVNNLDKRGRALMNAPSAIRELAAKEGPTGVLKAVAGGVGHLVKDTGEAIGDIAFEATHYEGEKSKERIASRALDVVLNTADIVTMVDGAGAVKNVAVGAGKTVAQTGRAVLETVKEGVEVAANGGRLVPAAGVVSSGGGALAATGPLLAPITTADAVKTGVFMAVGLKNGAKGANPGPNVAEAAESAPLKPYGGPGGGHHVPAKSAFKGAPGYDPKAALAIPNEAMEGLNVTHSAVSGAQQTLYRAFAKTGKELTWKAVAEIETKALIQGGMKLDMAKATVSKAIKALKDAGVSKPTQIPWSK